MTDTLTKKELLEDEPEGYEFDDMDSGDGKAVDKKAEAMKQFEELQAEPAEEEEEEPEEEEPVLAEAAPEVTPDIVLPAPSNKVDIELPQPEEIVVESESFNETPEDNESEDNVMAKTKYAETNPRGKPPSADKEARVLASGGGKDGNSPKYVFPGEKGYAKALLPKPKGDKAAAPKKAKTVKAAPAKKAAAPKRKVVAKSNGVDLSNLFADVETLKTTISNSEFDLEELRVQLAEKKTELANAVADL